TAATASAPSPRPSRGEGRGGGGRRTHQTPDTPLSHRPHPPRAAHRRARGAPHRAPPRKGRGEVERTAPDSTYQHACSCAALVAPAQTELSCPGISFPEGYVRRL